MNRTFLRMHATGDRLRLLESVTKHFEDVLSDDLTYDEALALFEVATRYQIGFPDNTWLNSGALGEIELAALDYCSVVAALTRSIDKDALWWKLRCTTENCEEATLYRVLGKLISHPNVRIRKY